MKTEDDKIKDLFRKHMNEEGNDIPDFGPMWQEVAARRKSKQRFVWRMAASICFLATIGLVVILNLQDHTPDSVIQLASWNEPSKTFMLPPPGSDLILARWTSPTDYLLPENKQHIK